MVDLTSIRSADNTTSLISYWIPSNQSIDDVRSQIRKEMSITSNIKNRNHGKALIHAFKRIDHFLSTVKQVPKSGLCIYSGSWV